MARKPNPLEEKAIEMYKSGKQLVEIAKELGKPEGTIRRWKSTHNWDGDNEQIKTNVRKEFKKKNERSEKKKSNIEKVVNETLENDELTDKQQMFCLYYVQSFNATQSYINAYGVDWATANANGSRVLGYASVRAEIERLKKAKAQAIMVGSDDIVELQMRIAFANIGDYAMFGRKSKPVWTEDDDGNPVPVIDPNTGKQKVINYNIVKLKESSMSDMRMIKSVKEGKDGISIQLEDRQKAIDWLTKYFELMPADRRKDEFAAKKLEMEMLKIELSQKYTPPEQEDDGFLDCLNASASEVWKDESEDG